MKNIRRAMACALGLLSFSGLAHAVPQMLLPATATKAAKLPPADIRSGAVAVNFNADELHSLAIGDEVELGLPNGTKHTFVFDQRIDHGDGTVTWIGYYRDRDQRLKLNAVITTGPGGSLGTIETPDGDFVLRLGNGGEWLLDAKAEQALSKPIKLDHDAVFVSDKAVVSKRAPVLARPDFAQVVPGVTVPFSSTVPMSDVVTKAGSPAIVDMLVVYNDSLVTGIGGAANVPTWANNLITQANTQFTNSLVNVQLRLAGTMLYSYPDGQGDATVLYDITGVDATTQLDKVTAAHTAMENKRVAVGADMVTFYRGGNGSTDGGSNFGSGIAWTAQGPVASLGFDWGRYTWSTVVGCYSTCTFIWTHEVGHNMGNMHDRATAAWEAGDGVNYGHGSTPDAFGFYTCNGRYDAAVLTCNPFTSGGCASIGEPNCSSGTNAFHDLMSYFHSTPGLVKQFSNPNLTCATSGLACGLGAGFTDPNMAARPASADTVTSMNANAVAMSALRPSVVTTSPVTATLAATANPTRIGNTVTMTVTLTSSAGTPTGTVAFSSNGATIAGCGTVAVSSGSAQCTTSFAAPGTYTLAAQLAGSGSFANATSNAVGEVVGAVPSMIGGMPRKLSYDVNATTDLAWMGPGNTGGAWIMNGLNFTPAVVPSPQPNAVIRSYGDFNGDGKSDLLWRAPDGTWTVSLMNGTAGGVLQNVVLLAGGQGWDVIGVGDFNGDGKPDLLWSGPDGSFGVWLMNGTAATSTAVLAAPAAGMYPLLLGDFDGDLKTDILWTNSAGAVTIALMNGVAAATTTGSVAQVLGPGSGWRPTGLADLNGDGKADIFWLANDGTTGAWLMNGTATLPGATAALLPAGSWRVVASTDLDGDGKMDIVWQNAATGEAAVWLMNGLTAKAGGQNYVYNGSDPRWKIVGVGDFNGDGKGDLLWKHTAGSYGFWLMNGATLLNYGVLLGDGTGWDVVAP